MNYLLAILGLVFLILVHELGHFMVAKAVGMHCGRFSIGFPPHIFRKQLGETEYCLGAIPLGGYVKISGMNREEELPKDVEPRAYFSQATWKKVAVISAGGLVNIAIAFILFIAFFVQGSDVYGASNELSNVMNSTPAQAAGLERGDRIVAINGVESSDVAHLREVVSRSEGAPLVVRVQRGNEAFEREITPAIIEGAPRLGIVWQRTEQPVGHESSTFMEAAGKSVEITGLLFSELGRVLGRLIGQGDTSEFSSVVGMVEVSQQTVGQSRFLFVLGFLSLNLGILNLLPLLPLDGGHIVVALVEKIRGRAMRPHIMERISFVGFAFFIMLFFFGLSNDITRLMNGGFKLPQ